MAGDDETSSFATPADIGDAIVQYHSEEADILSRRGRNDLAPVSRLPCELLREIFRLSVRDQYVKTCCWFAPWFSITHVCHRWRTVAISYPQLWTLIFFNPNRDCTFEVATMFAERSQECPLDIDVPASMSPANDAPWGLYKQFAEYFLVLYGTRVRSLCGLWLGPDCDLYNYLVEMSNCDFPNLEVLHILLPPAPQEYRQYEHLPNAFPPVRNPNIKHLYCRHATKCLIDELSGFSKLTKLAVVSPTIRLRTREWMIILKAIPTLVHLELSRAFRRVSSRDNLEDSDILDLRLLDLLRLEERGPQGATLLQFLGRCQISRTTRVCIDVSKQDPHHFISDLSSIATGQTPSEFVLAPITSCFLDSNKCILYTTQPEGKTTETNSSASSTVSASPEHVTWTIQFSKPTPSETLFADTVLSVFPLQQLRRFRVGRLYDSSTVFSPAGWQSFPDLSELGIANATALWAFFEADKTECAETSHHLFPNLQTLIVDSINLSKPAGDTSVARFIDELSSRKQRGAMIRCLKMKNCKLSAWNPRVLVEKGMVESVNNT